MRAAGAGADQHLGLVVAVDVTDRDRALADQCARTQRVARVQVVPPDAHQPVDPRAAGAHDPHAVVVRIADGARRVLPGHGRGHATGAGGLGVGRGGGGVRVRQGEHDHDTEECTTTGHAESVTANGVPQVL